MFSKPSADKVETMVRHTRHTRWAAFGAIVVLGGGAVASLLGHATPLAAALLAVTIAIIVVALRGVNPAAPAMRAVLDDELRQASLNRSYRNAMFAMLGLQPLLCLAIVWLAAPYPAALMACGTAIVGAATVLASMLVYDR